MACAGTVTLAARWDGGLAGDARTSADAEVWFTYEDGKPAAIACPLGKGFAVRFATFLGLEYIHLALNGPEYHNADSPRYRSPVQCSAALRDLIAWPARRAGAKPVVECSAPMVEVARRDGPKDTVLFLMNHAFGRQERAMIAIPDVPAGARTSAVSGARVETKRVRSGAEVQLPVGLTKVVVAERG
jgi:hypothetical protein